MGPSAVVRPVAVQRFRGPQEPVQLHGHSGLTATTMARREDVAALGAQQKGQQEFEIDVHQVTSGDCPDWYRSVNQRYRPVTAADQLPVLTTRRQECDRLTCSPRYVTGF